MNNRWVVVLALLSCQVSAAVFVTTNEMKHILRLEVPGHEIEIGENVPIAIALENQGETPLFLSRLSNLSPFFFSMKEGVDWRKNVPRTELGTVYMNEAIYHPTRWNATLEAGKRMDIQLSASHLFDMTAPGSYSLSMKCFVDTSNVDADHREILKLDKVPIVLCDADRFKDISVDEGVFKAMKGFSEWSSTNEVGGVLTLRITNSQPTAKESAFLYVKVQNVGNDPLEIDDVETHFDIVSLYHENHKGSIPRTRFGLHLASKEKSKDGPGHEWKTLPPNKARFLKYPLGMVFDISSLETYSMDINVSCRRTSDGKTTCSTMSLTNISVNPVFPERFECRVSDIQNP